MRHQPHSSSVNSLKRSRVMVTTKSAATRGTQLVVAVVVAALATATTTTMASPHVTAITAASRQPGASHHDAPVCTGPTSCSLAGVCSLDGSRCVCDVGFTGDTCASLDLSGRMHTTLTNLPAETNDTTIGTVWGGHPMRDSTTGDLHWFGSAFRDNKTLQSWLTASVIAHAHTNCQPRYEA
jgi:hypothetical protein